VEVLFVRRGYAHGCPTGTVPIARKRTGHPTVVIDRQDHCRNIGASRIKLTKTRVQPLSTRSRLLTAVGSFSVIPIFDAPPGEPSSAKKSALIWA